MRSYRDIRDRRYEKEAMSASLLKQVKAIEASSKVFRNPDEVAKAELPEPEQPKKLAYEKPEWMVRREQMR